MKMSVKLVKKKQNGDPERAPKAVIVGGQNSWSKVIQSWVVEFRQRDEPKLLPPFAQLFKADPSNSEISNEVGSVACLSEQRELID